MVTKQENTRNFCIIAHIDHGKSTLADRLLEYTGALSSREMEAQVLDKMDLEKERGITIKLKAVRINYQARDGHLYTMNLIDTPGHVDFNYEVSRSLAACEGALLVVDASQGIEAQTLANTYLALEHDLEIIPVINKVDLPNADTESVKKQIEEVIGLDTQGAILASAKTGLGTEEILEAIVRRVKPPKGDRKAPLKALIFDSHFDAYKGAIPYIKVVDGSVKKGMNIRMMGTGKCFEVTEVGIFSPDPQIEDSLDAGDVGYIAASIKNVKDTQVGDTITDDNRPGEAPLPGYRKATPMVYCGLYPINTNDYADLKDALEKLQLNDASLVYEPETSVALGFGFRCGFLGLLHMEIVKERLEREYNLELLTTAPSVNYRVTCNDGSIIYIDNPIKLPKPQEISMTEEPYVKASIMVPASFVGSVMEIANERRGQFINMEYITESRVMMIYDLPLSEIIFDFFDQLKSRTKGYASFDYEFCGYKDIKKIYLKEVT
jgi:GTP-binding protein LepA